MNRSLGQALPATRSRTATARPNLAKLGPLLLILLVWQATVSIAASPLLPTPAAVFTALVQETVHGPLLHHLGATLSRVAICFFLAMVGGSALGLSMAAWPSVNRWLDPWLQMMLNIPAMVTAIMAYVWLGLGEPAAILAVTLGKLPNIAVILREGGRQRDRELAEMAQIYRLSPGVRLVHLTLPELAPYLMAATRTGVSLVWKIVLLVELLGRSNGIGFQLHVYFQLLDVTRILAYSGSFMAVMLLIEYGVLAVLDRRIARWRR